MSNPIVFNEIMVEFYTYSGFCRDFKTAVLNFPFKSVCYDIIMNIRAVRKYFKNGKV